MKLVVCYKADSTLPVAHQTFIVAHFHSSDGVLNLYGPDRIYPIQAINIDELSHWFVREEVKLDNPIEQYLMENYGNLQTFYSHFATNPHAGQALKWALCQPDVYRLQKSGKFNGLNSEREIDSPKIVEILEWLKADAVNYPEDHPLWNQRTNR